MLAGSSAAFVWDQPFSGSGVDRASFPRLRFRGEMKDKELLPDSFYEERRITPKWRQGVLPNAGIWLADGGYHVAVCGSPAQEALVARGALLVASLVFD